MKRIHLIAALFGIAVVVGVSQEARARGRMYNPATGRFMQRDPVSTPAARNVTNMIYTSRDPLIHPDGPNLYQYVRSSPTMYVDPTGYAASAVTGTAATKTAQYVGIASVVVGILKSVAESDKASNKDPPCDCDDTKPDNPTYRDKDGKCCIKVQMVCRNLEGATGLIAQHCYLRVVDAKDHELGTITGGPESFYDSSKAYGKLKYWPDGDTGSGGSVIKSFGHRDDACAFVKCAHQYAQTLDGKWDYNKMSVNSNTFIQKILEHCNGWGYFPTTAWGGSGVRPPEPPPPPRSGPSADTGRAHVGSIMTQ